MTDLPVMDPFDGKKLEVPQVAVINTTINNVTINQAAPGHHPLRHKPGQTQSHGTLGSIPTHANLTAGTANAAKPTLLEGTSVETVPFITPNGDNGVTYQDHDPKNPGSVTVIQAGGTGVYTIGMSDLKVKLVTHSDKSGADGSRYLGHDYGHQSRMIHITPGNDDGWFTAPKVVCGSTTHEPSLTVEVHNKDIGHDTKIAVRNFFDQHPQLAAAMRRDKVHLAYADGISQTLDEIGHGLTANKTLDFCAAGKDAVTVVKR